MPDQDHALALENRRYCSLSVNSWPFVNTLPASLPSILSACFPSLKTSKVGSACRSQYQTLLSYFRQENVCRCSQIPNSKHTSRTVAFHHQVTSI